MGLLKVIQHWKSSFLPENRNVSWAVRADQTGFTQIRRSDAGEETSTFLWGEILAVAAYKRDLFAVGQIRLVFETESGLITEVSEEDEGCEELLLMLPKCINGFPPEKEWWEKVAPPAFATNWTPLYRRSQ